MLTEKNKKPEVIVFAGPNGSGKSTITSLAKVIPPYIIAMNGHLGFLKSVRMKFFSGQMMIGN